MAIAIAMPDRNPSENFLEKKLGLSGDLDAAIKAVCTTMKPDRTKSRLTFYYLLAEYFEKLDAL